MSRVRVCLALVVLLVGPNANAVWGQCMFANPSFEIPGSGDQLFAGWSAFGSTGSTTTASHGQMAARVTGPNSGGVSKFLRTIRRTTSGTRESRFRASRGVERSK